MTWGPCLGAQPAQPLLSAAVGEASHVSELLVSGLICRQHSSSRLPAGCRQGSKLPGTWKELGEREVHHHIITTNTTNTNTTLITIITITNIIIGSIYIIFLICPPVER